MIHVDRVGITAFIKRFFTRTGINSLRAEKNHHFFLHADFGHFAAF